MNPSYIKEIFRWQLLDPGSYDNLLEWAGTPSQENKRISNMMMRIFKCINFTNYPAYLKGLFQFRTVRLYNSLRGTNVLVLPKPGMLQRDIGTRFLILLGDQNHNRGIQRQFLENICQEDDLRSRIFGTFVVKFLACLPLLGFSNI